MVTRLDDATIKVVLDVEGAKRDADRLEDELREKEERGRRDRREGEEREGKDREREGRGGGAAAAAAGATALRGGFGRIAKTVAVAGGILAAVEYGTPIIAGAVKEAIRNVVGDDARAFLRTIGLDPEELVDDISTQVQEKVSKLFSGIQAGLGAASDAAAFARVQTLLDQGVDPEEIGKLVGEQFRVRLAQQLAERREAQIDRENLGETLADLLTGGFAR